MTEIKILLDKSGSMWNIKDDTIGGYNDFLTMQKKSENVEHIYWSLSTFSNDYEREFVNVPIKNVENLNNDNYRTNGSTALYDAIGTLLNETIEENNKTYIVVIITDGIENASKYYSAKTIKDMIDNKTSELRGENHANWDFIFLGANQDAILESQKIGIPQRSSMSYNTNAESIDALYKGVSNAISRKISQTDEEICFSQVERNATQPF